MLLFADYRIVSFYWIDKRIFTEDKKFFVQYEKFSNNNFIISKNNDFRSSDNFEITIIDISNSVSWYI